MCDYCCSITQDLIEQRGQTRRAYAKMRDFAIDALEALEIAPDVSRHRLQCILRDLEKTLPKAGV